MSRFIYRAFAAKSRPSGGAGSKSMARLYKRRVFFPAFQRNEQSGNGNSRLSRGAVPAELLSCRKTGSHEDLNDAGSMVVDFTGEYSLESVKNISKPPPIPPNWKLKALYNKPAWSQRSFGA